eukprot:TRINITY_DN2925_c0_g1_i10.p1 TRINITY_DN2925_c0_g1~~TRINITY_DN2925_c0_g1_i10.p1  ORF type:complete len:252 (+),score=14.26 TRINITY_DN2925_c0_g1_i10:915-1670(+)
MMRRLAGAAAFRLAPRCTNAVWRGGCPRAGVRQMRCLGGKAVGQEKVNRDDDGGDGDGDGGRKWGRLGAGLLCLCCLAYNMVKKVSLLRALACLGAAEEGDVEALAELIKKGADVNCADSNGCTPSHLAAKYGHAEALAMLIKAGADVNRADSEGHTPCHQAAQRGHAEALAVLIESGADVNRVAARHFSTPCHLAARRGHAEALAVLIKAGADVNRADSKGESPGHEAARGGHAEALAVLIEAGADVNVA